MNIMEKVYNKLVRDKIPEIIKEDGRKPVFYELSDKDFEKELEKKLIEECNEVIEAKGVEILGELADVYEVVRALAELHGSSIENISRQASNKRKKRGGFEDKIYLEKVIEE